MTMQEAIHNHMSEDVAKELLRLEEDAQQSTDEYRTCEFSDVLDCLDDIVFAEKLTRAQDPERAARHVLDLLDGAPMPAIGRILGVSKTTVSSWKKNGNIAKVDGRRAYLADLLVTKLRAMLPTWAVIEWFEEANPGFGGGTPIELLADPTATGYSQLNAFAQMPSDQSGV